jgi:protein-S-isoprenylcysteine O-methyltransferase
LHPLPFLTNNVLETMFFVSYAVWLAFEIFTGRSRKSHGTMKASDRGSFFLLVASVWTGIALDVLLCFRLPHAAIQRHRVGIFLIGIVFMWTGIAFRYYAMRVLGRYFTFDVATVLGQNVIEAGPYRYIRHPSYTGGIITILGLGFALGNWAGLFALLACVGVGYAYRIHVEESALVTAIGEPYRAYMLRTTRLMPFLL